MDTSGEDRRIRTGLGGSLRRRWRSAWPVLFSAVVFFAAWEGLIWLFAVPSFLVAPPSAIARALLEGIRTGAFLSNGLVTLVEALSGFVIGSAIGLLIGIAVVIFPAGERLIYPYVVALQSLPKVAIAPIFVVWFGFGITSKVVIVALVALFPVLVNVMVGLKMVDQERLDLMVGLSGTRWQIMRYLRLPTALPFIFAGLDTGIVYSLTSAIVGEFVGSTNGLGFMILQANYSLDIAEAFALFVILAATGVLFHSVMKFAAGKIVFWNKSEDFR